MKLKPLLIAVLLLTFLHTGTVHAYQMETLAKQAIIVDDSTGTVLFEKNADELMHPSSMSKLMTMMMVFEKLKSGALKMTDTFPVSEKAWSTQGSKMFVELGNQIPLEELIKGVIIQSGNDACIVLAEGLAGSEESFAAQMNAKAKEIGLTNSNFVNSTGWSDEKHLTTARDLSKIARYIIHEFPDFYHFYSQTEFTYHGIKQQNRNPLLGKNLGVDGLKTGHTDAAGYGVTISGVSPDNRRIIMVINGLSSMNERAEEAEKLITHAYRDFENVTVFKKGEVIDSADVWLGVKDAVPLTVSEDVLVTLPKARTGKLKSKLVYEGPIAAPIESGKQVAQAVIDLGDGNSMTVPLITAESVEKKGFFGRIIPNLKQLLGL